jgi:hypothetical protein
MGGPGLKERIESIGDVAQAPLSKMPRIRGKNSFFTNGGLSSD